MNEAINNIRQLLCQPDTTALRTQVCSLCTEPWMLDMVEQSIPDINTWHDRQPEIAKALEQHNRRYDEGTDYRECRFSMRDLAGADLRYADLRVADLSSADLSDARYDEHTQLPEGFNSLARGLVEVPE